MSSEETFAWTGPAFLAQVGGSAVDFSPSRVLFLAQRVRASGRLWMTRGADIRTLDLVGGALVGSSGFPDLLSELGVEGGRTDSLSDLIGRAASSGADPNEALGLAALGLGAFVVSCEGDPEWMVQFAPDAPGPEQPVAVPMSPVEMISAGLRQGTRLAEARRWMLVEGASKPAVTVPSDAPVAQWGLPECAMRLLEVARTAGRLDAIKVDGEVEWAAVATLRLLGLLDKTEDLAPAAPSPPAESSPPAAPSPPAESSPRAAPSPPAAPSPTLPSATAAEPKAQARFDRPVPRPAPEPQAKRRKRRGSRSELLEALSRSPWESPREQIEVHLKAAYDAIGASRAEQALNIRKTEELEPEVIEERYREACTRYHPDRYLSSTQAIRALAEGCFSRISECYHHLKDPVHLEQAKERLVFRETGKRPVNDKTRAHARVDFKRAEMMFRQRRYEPAAKASKRAQDGDPKRWEYSLLHLRSVWRAGLEDTEAVVKGILEIEDMPSTDRAQAVYLAGEMLMKDGRDREAHGLFKQAVGLDPENVGARRRIRLKESRKSAEEKSKPARPLFGGLFGRRGD